MPLIIETTKTGKPRIQYGNHKYRESNVLKNGEVVWRCLGSKCKSAVKTNAERTEIIDAKATHSGPHPTTMRTLLSPGVQTTRTTTPYASPAAECASSPARSKPGSPRLLASSATPSPTVPADLPHPTAFTCSSPEPDYRIPEKVTPASPLDQYNSVAEILRENSILKEEIAEIKTKYKTVLDHSVESDMRLLQYTTEVFASPLNKNRPAPENVDLLKSESADHSLHQEHTEQSRQDMGNIDALIEADNKLKYLEEKLAAPCPRCQILKEEAVNMINSIRILENELSSLRREYSTESPPVIGEPVLPKDQCNETPSEHNQNEGFVVVRRKRNKGRRRNNKRSKVIQKPIEHSTIRSEGHINKQSNIKLPFKNVTIMGDSHARHMAGLIGGMVRTGSTTVSGMCKPNAGLLEVAPAESSISPPDNCYVIIAGANDVASGKSGTVFGHLETIIRRCSASSSVLVCTLPYRHDLDPRSQLHMTTNVVNNYIEELCSRLQGVMALNISDMCRDLFTSHGLHLRMRGKSILAEKITMALSGFHRPSPISQGATERGARNTESIPTSSSPETELLPSPRTTPGPATYAEAVSGDPPADQHTPSSKIHDFLERVPIVTGQG